MQFFNIGPRLLIVEDVLLKRFTDGALRGVERIGLWWTTGSESTIAWYLINRYAELLKSHDQDIVVRVVQI